MKSRILKKSVLGICIGLALVGGALALLLPPQPREPVWNGHRLSEWLDMYDCSLRFDVGDVRHPPFTDAEIAQALDGIGTNALPFLQAWLLESPGRVKPWLNIQLNRLSWVHFRFALNEPNYSSFSETGFMYYGERARPLLPWLIKLTRSPNADTRLAAYEAAFFARPEKEIFLPLADQALHDPEAGCAGMAAQWMVERFPNEGVRRNLQSLYPQFYANSTNGNPVPP